MSSQGASTFKKAMLIFFPTLNGKYSDFLAIQIKSCNETTCGFEYRAIQRHQRDF